MQPVKEICQVFFDIKNKEKLEQLFLALFTLDELVELQKRMQILHYLNEGELSQREIAKKLGVSIATITRGSNALKQANLSFKKFLHDIKG